MGRGFRYEAHVRAALQLQWGKKEMGRGASPSYFKEQLSDLSLSLVGGKGLHN